MLILSGMKKTYVNSDVIVAQKEEIRLLLEKYGLSPTALARKSKVVPSTINKFYYNEAPKNALSAVTMAKIRQAFPLEGAAKAQPLSENEIALMDAIKDILAIMLQKNISNPSELSHLFNYQRQAYLRMKLPQAANVMDSLLEYVTGKPRESELQAIHKLLQLAPAGSA